MPGTTFTLADLMGLLTAKTGLPPSAHTTDPDARFSDIGLDSLAFINFIASIEETCERDFGMQLSLTDESPYDRDSTRFGSAEALATFMLRSYAASESKR